MQRTSVAIPLRERHRNRSSRLARLMVADPSPILTTGCPIACFRSGRYHPLVVGSAQAVIANLLWGVR